MLIRRIAKSVPAVAILLQAVVAGPTAFAAEPVTEQFLYNGATQEFVVPGDVTMVHVELHGGWGGSYVGATTGGVGGEVEGDLAVTPGETLYVEVGYHGADVALNATPGGYNGGGAGGSCGSDVPGNFHGASGGGATDIRTIPSGMPGSLESRLVVAGGGGGAGDTADGGSAGQLNAIGPHGGSGGNPMAGGAGGTGDVNGAGGALGFGGAGATTVSACGAGGGGGYYGGGGGGASGTDPTDGGSGGGGSNYLGSLTGASEGLDDTFAPHVNITYTPDLSNGAVSAHVTIPSSAACIELSTTSVDFGTLPLGSTDARGNPDVNVTNCSAVGATFYARGTDATGNGAAWALDDTTATCADTLAADSYHLSVREGVSGSTALWQLDTNNKVLQDVPAGSYAPYWPTIDTACPGSSGGGLTMSMQILFLATAAE
jgi:hypothetical protein